MPVPPSRKPATVAEAVGKITKNRHRMIQRPLEKGGNHRVVSQWDWDGIQREYEAGQLSILAIADLFGIDHEKIRKRAREKKWQRNMTIGVSAQVRARMTPDSELRGIARADLIRDDLGAEEARQRLGTEIAVRRGIEIVTEHRVGVKRLRTLVEKAATNVEHLLDKPAEEWSDSDKLILGKSQGITDAIDKLASAFEKLVRTERIAFNLDDSAGRLTDEMMRARVEAAKAELARRGVEIPVLDGEIVSEMAETN